MEEHDPQYRHYPVIETVIDMFGNWLNHRREVANACNCDSEEFSRIAHDLGVTTGGLRTLVENGPHSAEGLPKMLTALKLDIADIRRVEPLVLRDMERVCGLCTHKHRCDRELAAGTAAANHDQFCNNALTLDKLIEERNQPH